MSEIEEARSQGWEERREYNSEIKAAEHHLTYFEDHLFFERNKGTKVGITLLTDHLTGARMGVANARTYAHYFTPEDRTALNSLRDRVKKSRDRLQAARREFEEIFQFRKIKTTRLT